MEDLIPDYERVRATFEGLFRGDFDTGIYPDEWHWREGISKPDAVREIVNAWKSSRIIADVALREEIGQKAAELMGWEGARLAQDDIVWKPPGAGGVGFHRDSAYISDNFRPRDDNSVTVWIALDDADESTGVVEYVPGSHTWPLVNTSEFHGSDDRFAPLAGMEYEISALKVRAGSAVFHHQDVLHGSGPNTSPDRHRRALVLHFLRHDVKFRTDPPPDYIYGRYVLPDVDRTRLFDAFFPLVFASNRHISDDT